MKFAFFKKFYLNRELHKIDSLQQNPQPLLTNMYLNTSNTEGPTSPKVNKSQLQALPLLSGFSLNKSTICLLEKPVHCPRASSTCIQTEPL